MDFNDRALFFQDLEFVNKLLFLRWAAGVFFIPEPQMIQDLLDAIPP
jgi:hypothetical protein